MKTRTYFAIFGTLTIVGFVLAFYGCLQFYGGVCWRVPPGI